MDMRPSPAIAVEPLAANEGAWTELLARSRNATLFHDLRFLRYHPTDRFQFHHLMFKRDGRPVAVLPGGLAGTSDHPMFCSPLGASIGGFAVTADLRADLALSLVEALQVYAGERGWASVEITLPPACYSFEAAGTIEFALFCRGFRVAHRWLCPVLPLISGSRDGFERSYRSRQVTFVRAARRKGMVGVEAGLERFDDFLEVFLDTYDRHGVPATHTPEEIRDLLQRLPDQVRIHLAMLGEVPVAGLLVFRLTSSVANTFYICSSAEHAGEHGAAFVIADLIDRLSQAGYRYLDFGPSANDQKFNRGVTFFKEGLGAFGQCRDRWRWEVG
jgi:hypothetical protein